MAEVRIAACTQHFDSAHAQRIVLAIDESVGFQRRVKTRPAASGVEFGFGIKQRTVAALAQVGAGAIFIPIHARERPLGTRLAGNRVFFW